MAKEKRDGETLSRVYEEKSEAEVTLHALALPVVGKDIWITEQLGNCKAILDVGCGKGRMISLLGTEGRQVYGIDISETWVEMATKVGYEDTKVCDINSESFPFEDEFFDAAICLDLLEHLIDPVHALAQVSRVLKPHGLLAISTPNIAFIGSRLALLIGHHTDLKEIAILSLHLRYYTFNSMRRLLKEAGFEVVKAGGYPIKHWRYRRIELWRPCLWLLSKIRPQLFAPDIVLIAQKKGPPKQQCWQYPPIGSIRGWKRLKNLWDIT